MLRYGSTGDDVKELQQKLNDGGAVPPLVVDGIFGPKTRGAVVAYQGGHGLSPDGIVGPLTWGSLDAGPGPKPQPDDPRKKLLDQITITVVGHDSSSAAIDEAKKIQDAEWRNLSEANLKTLVGLTVELHVIPADKKMTDLDEFKALKGQKTFDGRLWDDVRGINMGKIGDKIISAVGEETLVNVEGKPPGYALGFVASHESGHAIRSSFTPDQDANLEKIYKARISAKGQPQPPKTGDPPDDKTLDDWLAPRWYTASNSDEYLAQSVAAFFSHPYSDDDNDKAKYTPGWLQKNDPDMYTFLHDSVYVEGTVP
jgi:hypothetical protein